jgi:hypothetical protein
LFKDGEKRKTKKLSSGMSCCTDKYKFTDISEEHTASIFRVKEKPSRQPARKSTFLQDVCENLRSTQLFMILTTVNW